VLLRAGDFDHAEGAYRSAGAADPRDLDAQVGLGIALRGRGKHRQAQAVYEKVLEQEPDNLAALFDLGVLHADFTGEPKRALPLFHRYLELAPKNAPQRTLAERYVQDIGMATGDKP
jgi:cytochrome c-type biogenesis protein CcmH/NrfG